MNDRQTNLGPLERLVRVAGGALLATVGVVLFVAADPSWWVATTEVAAILLGIDFVYTGVTGYCPLYHRLGWSTLRRSPTVAPRSAPGAEAKPPASLRR
jgi:uncharacterized membrane protein